MFVHDNVIYEIFENSEFNQHCNLEVNTYIQELNEEIRYHINTIWKNVILYLKRYNAYLTRVLVYCFIFGLLILLLCVIAYAQFDWSLYTDVHKKFYKFFI